MYLENIHSEHLKDRINCLNNSMNKIITIISIMSLKMCLPETKKSYLKKAFPSVGIAQLKIILIACQMKNLNIDKETVDVRKQLLEC